MAKRNRMDDLAPLNSHSVISMTQEQIEAVRMNLRRSFEAWAEPLDKLAGEALDHLTKANEELRAEVERLQNVVMAFNNGMPAMTTKDVVDELTEARATIASLTEQCDNADASKVGKVEWEVLHTPLHPIQYEDVAQRQRQET